MADAKATPEGAGSRVATASLRARLLAAARVIVSGPSLNRTKTAGYGVQEGEHVLLVSKTTDDPLVTEVLVEALQEAGATVDIFRPAIEDRELTEVDEFRSFTNIEEITGLQPDENHHRWRKKFRSLERLVEQEEYALLVQGRGGALPFLDGARYEGAPWMHRVTFPAASYPWPLWDAINAETWRPIWEKGKNAEVHLTDPEGTDLRFILPESHWHAETYEKTGSRRRFQEQYYLAHLYGWVTAPYPERPQLNGVVAGTLNHNSSPFPHCKIRLEGGKLVEIEGGAKYGAMWNELLKGTDSIQYPEHPGPGLFWMWECAIGTHPKMVRAPFAWTLSGQGAGFERLRAGIIHIGIGTSTASPSEKWAASEGLPYGHCHIHLNFPTYVIRTQDGEEINVITDGRLASLDAGPIRDKAAEFGDPDELLTEAWVPPVPGISVAGDYWNDYAHDPLSWLKAYDEREAAASAGWSS